MEGFLLMKQFHVYNDINYSVDLVERQIVSYLLVVKISPSLAYQKKL